jgi:hypothetical protein
MYAAEVTAFLTDLGVRERVAASTQNQALNALVFLYTQVLGLELGRLDAVRAKRGKYLPTVLAAEADGRPIQKTKNRSHYEEIGRIGGVWVVRTLFNFFESNRQILKMVR